MQETLRFGCFCSRIGSVPRPHRSRVIQESLGIRDSARVLRNLNSEIAPEARAESTDANTHCDHEGCFRSSSGEGGIRTPDTPCEVYRFSKPARSTAPPPLRDPPRRIGKPTPTAVGHDPHPPGHGQPGSTSRIQIPAGQSTGAPVITPRCSFSLIPARQRLDDQPSRSRAPPAGRRSTPRSRRPPCPRRVRR